MVKGPGGPEGSAGRLFRPDRTDWRQLTTTKRIGKSTSLYQENQVTFMLLSQSNQIVLKGVPLSGWPGRLGELKRGKGSSLVPQIRVTVHLPVPSVPCSQNLG